MIASLIRQIEALLGAQHHFINTQYIVFCCGSQVKYYPIYGRDLDKRLAEILEELEHDTRSIW